MNQIDVSRITAALKDLSIDANFHIGQDVIDRINKFKAQEESSTAIEMLDLILKNHAMAAAEKMPLCQDTGVAVVFLELGQEVQLTGGDLYTAINEGVRHGYQAGYLRKSMVDDPVIERKNTTDNTPALVYIDLVPGDSLKITLAPKGGGAENMSEIKMMKVADGLEGMKEFVVERVKKSGGNPCPPVIVGVGLGGNFEQSALLAKKALLRPLTEENPDPKWASVEEDLLAEINQLGIGPQGFGGRTTALAVQILAKPCHIASMPVAVNMQCHCHRHKSITLN